MGRARGLPNDAALTASEAIGHRPRPRLPLRRVVWAESMRPPDRRERVQRSCSAVLYRNLLPAVSPLACRSLSGVLVCRRRSRAREPLHGKEEVRGSIPLSGSRPSPGAGAMAAPASVIPWERPSALRSSVVQRAAIRDAGTDPPCCPGRCCRRRPGPDGSPCTGGCRRSDCSGSPRRPCSGRLGGCRR